MTMSKFRAIIPEKRTTIFFRLNDLCQDNCINRDLLWPFLKSNGIADIFTGIIGVKNNIPQEIYDGDIVQSNASGELLYLVSYSTDWAQWFGVNIPNIKFASPLLTFSKRNLVAQELRYCKIVGNMHQNPELLKYAEDILEKKENHEHQM